jgi:hypothetical protein
VTVEISSSDDSSSESEAEEDTPGAATAAGASSAPVKLRLFFPFSGGKPSTATTAAAATAVAAAALAAAPMAVAIPVAAEGVTAEDLQSPLPPETPGGSVAAAATATPRQQQQQGGRSAGLTRSLTERLTKMVGLLPSEALDEEFGSDEEHSMPRKFKQQLLLVNRTLAQLLSLLKSATSKVTLRCIVFLMMCVCV